MKDTKISLMEISELNESARILSVAMLDAKLHVAVLQGKGENERREIEKMFFGLFTHLPGIVFLAKEKQDIIGVMRMKSCEGYKPVDNPKDPIDENDVEWRKSVWHTEWAHHEPKGQHWHLGPIGVLPSHQGLGIGSMLMERFCKEVDACMAKAYLETDVDKNVRFYEKFGFKVISESKIFGIKNRYMSRDSRV
ncbi:MAG: GNAT family N-acetyltransferase [Deltaproteobacteria bacterium]|uniref:GNAT family N-acetyltransferase n=1 Tax=Desulfobacula sp. TaxID=2593537 RepID=UPI0019CA0038|nr:GNAT family N-acetyltransferase [Candidatus Desulfobacula maris]MBL6995265.1 GNAT family N-acetyltransferase [Desulfobacula sp.]